MAASGELVAAVEERRVSFDLDEELYPRDAVYGAAYLFVDRCWVFLERPSDASEGSGRAPSLDDPPRCIRVRLKTKEPTTREALEALAGEFANELLNQLVRFQVGQATAKLREYTLARALFTDDTRSTIDQLLAELDAEEMEGDPLEIPVPWEKKEPG